MEAPGIEPVSLRAGSEKLLPCMKVPRRDEDVGMAQAIPQTMKRLTCVDVCEKCVNQDNGRCSESETLRAFCQPVPRNSSVLEIRSVNDNGSRPRLADQLSILFI